MREYFGYRDAALLKQLFSSERKKDEIVMKRLRRLFSCFSESKPAREPRVKKPNKWDAIMDR